MTKKISFCFGLLLLTIFTYAQLQVSVIGGIHKTTITPGFLNYPDTSIGKAEIGTSGIEIGFAAEIPISGKLYFRPSVIYSVKGSQWNQIYDTVNLVAKTKNLKGDDKIRPYSLDTKLHLAYIEMPLNIMYKTNIGAKTKFLIAAGPQVSLFYNGYIEVNNLSVSQDSAVKAKTYFVNEKNTDLPVGKLTGQYRTLHFGANALTGVEFGRVYFTINYSKDLTMFYEEDDRKYKASTVGACMGVYFGQREKSKKQ